MCDVKLLKSMFGYVRMESSPEDAVRVLKAIRDLWGKDTENVNDSIRIVSRFDVFYESLRRKFKEYIAPRRSESDMIKGLVVVDKVKLVKEGGRRVVTLIFDRSVSIDRLKELLDTIKCRYTIEG